MGFTLPIFSIKEKIFLSPERATEELKIKKGDQVIDYGAGIGFWTLPLSKAVGREGKVYALTSNENFITLLEKKKDVLGLNNVEVVYFDLEKGKIEIKEKVDLILMANVLHVINDKAESLKRAESMLKDDGRIVIIDFLKKREIFGPPLRYRVSEEEVMSIAEKTHLEYKYSVETGSHHFGLVFIKSN